MNRIKPRPTTTALAALLAVTLTVTGCSSSTSTEPDPLPDVPTLNCETWTITGVQRMIYPTHWVDMDDCTASDDVAVAVAGVVAESVNEHHRPIGHVDIESVTWRYDQGANDTYNEPQRLNIFPQTRHIRDRAQLTDLPTVTATDPRDGRHMNIKITGLFDNTTTEEGDQP